MLAGISEILIISTPRDISVFEGRLDTGEQLGMEISYAVQEQPRGLADAFIIGADFIGNDRVALVLGDDIFYGKSFSKVLEQVVAREKGAMIFSYYVRDPREHDVAEIAKNVKPSARGENEITSINNEYFIDKEQLIKQVEPLMKTNYG